MKRTPAFAAGVIAVLTAASMVPASAGTTEYEYVFQPAPTSPSGFAGEIFFHEPTNPVNTEPVVGYNLGDDSGGDETVTTYGSLADIDLGASFVTFPNGSSSLANGGMSPSEKPDNLQWDGTSIEDLSLKGVFTTDGGAEKIDWVATADSLTGSVYLLVPGTGSYDLQSNYDPRGTWIFDQAVELTPDSAETALLLAAALGALALTNGSRRSRWRALAESGAA